MVEAANGSPVHIVVTCANRKRYVVPDNLRLRHLNEPSPGPRFTAWTRRLDAEPASIPATDLYGGEHWQVARSLPSLVGESARLWVCSAGYGLVPADTQLNPYAATFSPGDPDSVGTTWTEARDWWRRLTEWPGPDARQPRSFTELARRNPTASVVAVLSDAYIRACSGDLLTAGNALHNRDRFAVIGPASRHADLDDLLVPVTARLRSIVGGSLQALHARVAAHLLTATTADNGGITRTRLCADAREATSTAPPDSGQRAPGTRLTDDDVRVFIRQELANGPASATILLRRLRQSGRSCEQSRFRHLYLEIAPMVRP